jgi:two-component system, OmpR family, phosphate regulon sensor histidine kinase PhoR
MSRKLIWFVSFCMALAMAALIIVQAYWLKNAWLLKEKQFNQLISTLMLEISQDVERQEAQRIITHMGDPMATDTGFARTGSDPRDKMANWLNNRRQFVDRIVSSLFMVSPQVEKRISPADLEEITRKEFESNHVDLAYEYAVIRSSGEIAFRTDGYNPAAEADYYRVQLFPEDISVNANFMSLYFPDKRNFLVRSLSYLAFSSLLLIVAIVGSFAVTILIMFRQKRLSEIRSDFVSNMTHELKTPISTISLASQMLGDKSIPSEIKNTEQISKIISEECRRLGSQVEKVLQTSVFDKGKLKLRPVEVDMHEILTSVVDNFSIQVKNRNGKISASLGAEQFVLQADQVHITNVLSNLLDNAIKYCNRNPEIRIETANRGEYLVITVADNGIGIGKADQKRVFEKFYRVPTGNVHTVKGFGLGLSYVKMILEAHQGHVELDSELFEGSTFKLYMPLQYHGSHTKNKNSAG